MAMDGDVPPATPVQQGNSPSPGNLTLPLSAQSLDALFDSISGQRVHQDDSYWELNRRLRSLYYAFVCSKAQRYGLEAEDEWQNFMLKLFRNSQTVDHAIKAGHPARAYLQAMLRNQLSTALRKDRTSRQRDDEWSRSMTRQSTLSTPETELLAAVRARQHQREVSHTLRRLSKRDHEVLTVKSIFDRDRAKAAEHMGVSVDEWSALVVTAIRHARAIRMKVRTGGAR